MGEGAPSVPEISRPDIQRWHREEGRAQPDIHAVPRMLRFLDQMLENLIGEHRSDSGTDFAGVPA